MFNPPMLHGDSLSQAPRLLAYQTWVNITLVWPSKWDKVGTLCAKVSFPEGP